MVCYEPVDSDANSVDRALWKDLSCGHSTCNDCLRGTCAAVISDGDATRLLCPHPDCHLPLDDNFLAKLFNPEVVGEDGARLLKLASHMRASQFMAANQRRAAYCPNPHCGLPVMLGAAPVIDTEAAGSHIGSSGWTQIARRGKVAVAQKPLGPVTVKCGGCSTRFCTGCKRIGGHEPASCDHARNWASIFEETEALRKRQMNAATEAFLSANTQTCPQCGSSITRNGGCNHMKCSICGCDFCYVCGKDWRGHDNYYSCMNDRDSAKNSREGHRQPNLARAAARNSAAGAEEKTGDSRDALLDRCVSGFRANELDEARLRGMGKALSAVVRIVGACAGSTIEGQFSNVVMRYDLRKPMGLGLNSLAFVEVASPGGQFTEQGAQRGWRLIKIDTLVISSRDNVKHAVEVLKLKLEGRKGSDVIVNAIFEIQSPLRTSNRILSKTLTGFIHSHEVATMTNVQPIAGSMQNDPPGELPPAPTNQPSLRGAHIEDSFLRMATSQGGSQAPSYEALAELIDHVVDAMVDARHCVRNSYISQWYASETNGGGSNFPFSWSPSRKAATKLEQWTGELETLTDTMDAVIGLDVFDQALTTANSSSSYQTLRLNRLLRSWATNGPSEFEVARVLQGVDCLELFSRIIVLGEDLDNTTTDARGSNWAQLMTSFNVQNPRDGVVPQLRELRLCLRDRTNRIVDASRSGYFGVTSTPAAENNNTSFNASSNSSASRSLISDNCVIS